MKSAACITILSISIVVIVYMYLTQKKEGFEEALKLSELNTCERNLAFKGFSSALNTASERARATHVQLGTCPNAITKSNIPPEMSILEENKMQYTLQSTCISLTYKSVDLNVRENSNTVSFTFQHNDTNRKNLLYLFLSNPVYVEFESSDAYKPDYNSVSFFSNYRASDEISMRFTRLVPFEVKSKNAAFDYTNAKELKDVLKNPTTVNIKLYYLNTVHPIKLHPAYDGNTIGQISVYNRKYFSSLDKNTDEFAFHDKMYTLLKHAANPILTCHLELQIPSTQEFLKKKTEVFKLYMDASLGSYTSCPNFTQLKTNKNNIVSAYLLTQMADDTFVNLALMSNNNKDGSECQASEILNVELPFVPGYERIQVTFTVSPYEKIVLCTWNVDGRDYYSFRRSAQCNKDNQFKKLVEQGTNEDIKLAYISKYVRAVKYIQLGQKSYMDDFNPR